jgi:hypothetical protein
MWRWLTRRYSRERELERELNAHLELEQQEQIDTGAPAGEAGYAARRALGNLVLIREVVREAWGWGSVERLLQDVRYGLRRLAKNPGFTAVAASALALGIGVNTAIFSFADVILNRPVSLARLDRLVSIRERASDSGDFEPLAPADYLAMKATARSFEQLATYEYWGASFGSRNGPEQIPGARVTADFFAAMSVTPARGRTFLPEEQAPGQNRVLVLSDRFWHRRFASDTAILGRTMQLNGEPYTIVGVMPATFNFPLGGQQFWARCPWERPSAMITRGATSFRLAGCAMTLRSNKRGRRWKSYGVACARNIAHTTPHARSPCSNCAIKWWATMSGSSRCFSPV